MEKVYENAMMIELVKHGLLARQQELIKVCYGGQYVGEYFADILVNNIIILELKSVELIRAEHHRQLLNYLKATGKTIGFILNFGKKAEFKRMVLFD